MLKDEKSVQASNIPGEKSEILNLEPMDPAKIEEVLDRYEQDHVTHKKGAIIFTGSGVGKTTYSRNQQPNDGGKIDWVDMDPVYKEAGAPPCEEHEPGTPGSQIKPLPWWTWGDEAINEVEIRSDIVNKALVERGFWGLTTSFTPDAECQPTAIVLLPWDEHKRRIVQKWEQNSADGGAKPTEEGFKLVQGHRKWTEEVAKRNNIPVFEDIDKAVEYVRSLETNS